MTDTIRPLIAGNWKMNGLKASMAEFEAMLAGAPGVAGKADLLQPVGIGLAELFGRDFGMTDLGQRRLSESPENVGDAPDTETDDQNAHHHGHYGFAEPV